MKVSLTKKILLAFEQSSDHIKYDKVYIMKDGPNNCRQITLSFGLTEYGNLQRFVEKYIAKKGRYASDFSKYVNIIGKKSLVDDEDFINLLKTSAFDPVMQICQEQAFDDMYITPAQKWSDENKITLPLSQLVIADSFLQSGSILMILRVKFAENVPAKGGDEKNWIKCYCTARKAWMLSHTRPEVQASAYRMNFMLDRINANDWNLDDSKYVANGLSIDA